ncbi:MAG: MXAN_5187 C-terminal domain-containing protein [Pseudomonadota bacterium]
MFWSKIWFFLVGTTAALAIGTVVAVSRPIDRRMLESEGESVARAAWGSDLLLRENAREWIDLASSLARAPAPGGQPRLRLDGVLDEVSKTDEISSAAHKTARDTLEYLREQIAGKQKPELLLALDKWGRLVAGSGAFGWKIGDDLSGYFLVEDALRGYLRDDLWLCGGKLYRMAAAPVIERLRTDYVGAVIIGDEVDMPLALALETRFKAHFAFFAAGQLMVSSVSLPITKEIQREYERLQRLKGTETGKADAPSKLEPTVVVAGDRSYRVAISPLPGEAGARGAFYATFVEQSQETGVLGALKATKRDDLAWASFPWLSLAGAFLAAIAIGMVLMWLEADRPARKLLADAVLVGKGERPKLADEEHKGKYGSIARSLNIMLEKLQRSFQSSKNDLSALVGSPSLRDFGQESRSLPLQSPAPSGPAVAPSAGGFSFEPPYAKQPASPFPAAPAMPTTAPFPVESSMGTGMPEGSDFDFLLPPPPPPSAPPPPPMAARNAGSSPKTPPSPFGMRPPTNPASQAPFPSPAVPSPPPAQSAMPSSESMPGPEGLFGMPEPSRRQPGAFSAAPGPSRGVPSPWSTTDEPLSEKRARAGANAGSNAGAGSSVEAVSEDDFRFGGGDDENVLSAPTQISAPPESLRKLASSHQSQSFDSETIIAGPSEELIRQTADDGDASQFRRVFEEFIELKRRCGETTDGVAFEKFVEKLRVNRDQLIGRYACKTVKFQVYVKDGKAALRATPVRS